MNSSPPKSFRTRSLGRSAGNFDTNRGREVQKVLAPFLQRTQALQIIGSVQGVCRDPEDDHLIECAQKAGAEIIVTGDKDLLSLERVEDIRMLSPRQYLGVVP